jgi:hypothetical protein
MSSPTIAALSRRPKYISDSDGIGANMGIGRDWVEPNEEPQLKPAGGESELLAELLRILERKQREGAAGALERIPTGPIGGAVAAVSPDTYANMANTDLSGEIGNAGNAPDAMMLALGGGLEQAGLRRQSASPASDALVQQLMKSVQPASSNSLVSPESAPEWMRTAASGNRGGPMESETMRVYSGGTSTPSDFWSENPGRAASFGPNVWVVEIPRSVFEAGKAQAAKLGQPTKWDTVLPNEWAKKSSQVPSENLGR